MPSKRKLNFGSIGIFIHNKYWVKLFKYTVGTESIRTAERISRENAFFKTLPKIEFSVEFNKIFFKG
jgi:hypothetical protein